LSIAPIVCRDEASNAWWRATVKEVRGEQILVHYMGCDDAWDTWMDASSPDIARVEASEADRAAFQQDDMEAGLDDMELLEKYRRQQWEANSRWQLNVFAQGQLGSWEGVCTPYAAEVSPSGGVEMLPQPSAPCSSHAAVEKNNAVECSETGHDARLALNMQLTPSSFDREKGCMTVGTAYTMSRRLDAEAAGGLLIEVGLREKAQRVRCKFLYLPDDESRGSGPAQMLRLEKLAVVRENVVGTAAPAASPPGGGLYDPPPGDRTNYFSLYCEDGLTLVFPTTCATDAAGFISVDWTAGAMRYQADRKFHQLDGSLASLELTEISAADAETYLPDFNTGQ